MKANIKNHAGLPILLDCQSAFIFPRDFVPWWQTRFYSKREVYRVYRKPILMPEVSLLHCVINVYFIMICSN